MKVVIQRVSKASVSIKNRLNGKIGNGLLLLVGFANSDSKQTFEWMIKKILNLRIFSDEAGKMNLSLLDVAGEILVVSNFTLYADAKKGNRPSYIDAANPETAKLLYNDFLTMLKESTDLNVQSGEFGADMQIDLINDGPVTIILEK